MTTKAVPHDVHLSHFCYATEKEQVRVRTVDAESELRRLNAACAKGWRWGLAAINFIDDDGVGLPLDEANAIRRACGVVEW